MEFKETIFVDEKVVLPVTRIRAKPGEVLMFEMHDNFDPDQTGYIQSTLEKFFPNNKVVIYVNGTIKSVQILENI